jgi:hypothetical protein
MTYCIFHIQDTDLEDNSDIERDFDSIGVEFRELDENGSELPANLQDIEDIDSAVPPSRQQVYTVSGTNNGHTSITASQSLDNNTFSQEMFDVGSTSRPNYFNHKALRRSFSCSR